jgi:4'-phosphopantetheinyl transferase
MRRQDMENGVSVDDFLHPRNLDSAHANRTIVALPQVAAGLELWWVALERPANEVAQLALTLSAEERARALRFGTEALRQRWIAGRGSLRVLLGHALAVAPAAVNLVRGRRGRPQVAGPARLDFNVSHTRGMALIGIADALPAGMRIGVDVEHGERHVNADGLSRKFLTERERNALAPLSDDPRRRAFLRLWTCKEAMSKATGDALSAPFRHLDVATEGGLSLVKGPPPYVPKDWRLHPVAMPDGFLATVAIWQSAGSVADGSP